MSRPSEARWETIEGQIALRDIGGQVHLECEGDGWYCCITLTPEATQGITDWFTVRKLVEP